MGKRCWLKIYGVVQGVGFRFSTQSKARQLKIVGLARNEPDGSVYIEAQGEAEVLDEFIQWCRRGPKSAEVSKVKYGFFNKLDNYQNFLIY